MWHVPAENDTIFIYDALFSEHGTLFFDLRFVSAVLCRNWYKVPCRYYTIIVVSLVTSPNTDIKQLWALNSATPKYHAHVYSISMLWCGSAWVIFLQDIVYKDVFQNVRWWGRCDTQNTIIESWMEWSVRSFQISNVQNTIKIVSFSFSHSIIIRIGWKQTGFCVFPTLQNPSEIKW